MAKVSLSGHEKSIEFIFSWYEDQIEALNNFNNQVIATVFHPNHISNVTEKFISLTFEEINTYFDNSKKEFGTFSLFGLNIRNRGIFKSRLYKES